MIGELKPFLEPGDIVIDGGNSLFTDTERRVAELKPTGIRFKMTEHKSQAQNKERAWALLRSYQRRIVWSDDLR